MMYRDHDGVGAIAGVLFLLLFGGALAALVVGLMMLFRRGGRPAAFATAGPGGQVGPGGPVGPAPAPGWGPEPGYPSAHPILAAEQTLADRLARGEIDVADYEQRLAALRRSRPLPPPPPGAPGGPASATFGTPPPATPQTPPSPPAPGTPPAAD